MLAPSRSRMHPGAAGALVCFAGAAACAIEALRTHLWISSLGPICGLERPELFLFHCPACPVGIGLAVVGAALALTALAANARPSSSQPVVIDGRHSSIQARWPAR